MKQRPVNLNFLTIHFPITAWVSIGHRLSGIFVFLLIPVFLWALQESLISNERMMSLKNLMMSAWVKGIIWILLTALFYHLIAGIRHLLMDIHIGDTKIIGRFSAQLVVGLAIISSISVGYWLMQGVSI